MFTGKGVRKMGMLTRNSGEDGDVYRKGSEENGDVDRK